MRLYLTTHPIPSTAAAKRAEEGGRGPAAGDGEAGARAQPAHPRAEAHPQRGPEPLLRAPRAV